MAQSSAILGRLVRVVTLALVRSSVGDQMWPPLPWEPSENGFGDSWQAFSGDLAAHSTWGGRTLASRSANGPSGVLYVFLPGTFTIPAQYNKLLSFAVAKGLDTIGLDYGWAPAPDGVRSAACSETTSCDACQENIEDTIVFGEDNNLTSGPLHIFGDNESETWMWTHFFAHGVQSDPNAGTLLQTASLDGDDPEPLEALEYIHSLHRFSVEALLASTLEKLGWTEYLARTGTPLWSKIVISGHSQGATHAAYVAHSRPVLGALLISSPQVFCGENQTAWMEEGPMAGAGDIYGCYSLDEPGRAAIERNAGFFTELRNLSTSGEARDYGEGSWCAPAEHCATALDDQLVQAAVHQCFHFLRRFVGSWDVVLP